MEEKKEELSGKETLRLIREAKEVIKRIDHGNHLSNLVHYYISKKKKVKECVSIDPSQEFMDSYPKGYETMACKIAVCIDYYFEKEHDVV